MLSCLLGHEGLIVRLAIAISVLRIKSKYVYQHKRRLGSASLAGQSLMSCTCQ